MLKKLYAGEMNDNLELRHLRYFVAVAQELHFGRAAKNLIIAQPALSQQIKQLEKEMGVKLLYRTKREVQLTKAGKMFLDRTNQILVSINEACEEAQRIHNEEIGQLKIAFAGFIISDLMPSILRNFQHKYPSIKLYLKHMTTTEQLKALKEREIDIGILSPPSDKMPFQLQILILREEPFVVALPKTHNLIKQGPPIDLFKLENEPFIIPPRKAGSSYYDSIFSICSQFGFSPKVVQEQQDLQTLISLVAAGMGVTILPNSINIFNENVAYLEIDKTNTRLTTAVAWNPNNQTPILQSFINYIKDSVI